MAGVLSMKWSPKIQQGIKIYQGPSGEVNIGCAQGILRKEDKKVSNSLKPLITNTLPLNYKEYHF